MTESLYEHDFYAWANEQAALLRAGKFLAADIEKIAEEIESMGKSEKRELVSRLTILLLHLLKWQYQPERRGNSWRNTIMTQRFDVDDHLVDSPSLRAKLAQTIADAYKRARLSAATETEFDADAFPATCPWTFEQIMDEGFWPEASFLPH